MKTTPIITYKNPASADADDFRKKVRLIAFYLPQFHPVPENDEWWGKGFTEWTNVTKARPLFREHYQPHLPADLGFYDLRLPEVREEQAALAKQYGIHGFCYYHYWFNGKRILERPFNEVLSSGKPDYPFCLCWANENWTRTWDGQHRHMLLEQKYSESDDLDHIRYLAKAFVDPRYIRVNGKPLMIVYRANNLPNPQETANRWREECRKLGVGEIYLCKVESHESAKTPPEADGFDANIEFQPRWGELGKPLRQGWLWRLSRKMRLTERAYGANKIYDYSDLVRKMLARKKVSHKEYSCVTPSWDNSARREKAVIVRSASPKLFKEWLTKIIERFTPYSEGENFIFLNAWNEWAEGAHLEPCRKWGRQYLEATREALTNAVRTHPRLRPPNESPRKAFSNMTRVPMISIIIPTYDRPELLERALKSILRQTLEHYEILVVQNGSVEHSKPLVQKMKADGVAIVYLYDSTPDPVAARNTGIQQARGKYIAFLDDDDEWLPEKLEKQAAILDRDPDVGVVGCRAPIFFEGEKSRNVMRRHEGLISFKRLLVSGCVIRSLSCVLVRRECFERFGLFKRNLPITNDYEFYFRILQGFKIYMLPEELIKYHRHGANMTTNTLKMCEETITVLRLISEENHERSGVSRRFMKKIILWREKFWQAKVFHAIAEEAYAAGKFSDAAYYFRLALMKDACVGKKIKWNRSRHPFYRLFRPYIAALRAVLFSLGEKNKNKETRL